MPRHENAAKQEEPSPSPPQTVAEAARAIRTMQVRGAAAIGVLAAHSLAASVNEGARGAPALASARVAANRLDEARPSAASLHNALALVLRAIALHPNRPAAAARRAAVAYDAATKAWRRRIAAHGAKLIADDARVLTHCHSSTVVAMLQQAWRAGHRFEVFATETRPFRQGLVTSRALATVGIPTTLVVDSACAHVLATQAITNVFVGADTVTAEGDLVNKVGTYGLATLAREHRVALHCAVAPHKFTRRHAAEVAIEERDGREIARPGDGRGDVHPDVRLFNPVFDRTPARLLAGYVTPWGVQSPKNAVQSALPWVPEEAVWG